MKNGTLAHVLARSFFIQGSWNFERMLNQGLAYSLLPGLREIYGEGKELDESVKRYMEFFNTHPYLAAPMIGAMLRLEEENGSGGADEIRVFKQRIMGIGGALGDPFYWKALRPLMGLVGVAVAWLGSLWAPVVALVVYNVAHLPLRIGGFVLGYREGPNVVQRLRTLDLPSRARGIKALYYVAAGALGGAWAGGLIGGGPEIFEQLAGIPAPLFPLAASLLILICQGLMRKGGPVESVLLLLTLATLLTAYLAGARAG
ncbi:MAG: PTS mannose/fructose/sorbose transporter family subunit IID [Myxococcales bacterium]|nr:PTS mannose/fructose/sorbose transporter family subunit IID [Myxococcales bacterium]